MKLAKAVLFKLLLIRKQTKKRCFASFTFANNINNITNKYYKKLLPN